MQSGFEFDFQIQYYGYMILCKFFNGCMYYEILLSEVYDVFKIMYL